MRRWIFPGLLAALIASQIWGPPACRLFAWHGHGMSAYRLEITGRLIDDITGLPLGSTAVLGLEHDVGLDDPLTLTGFAALSEIVRTQGPEAGRRGLWDLPWWMDAGLHGLSDAVGRFRIEAWITSCVGYVNGEPTTDPEPSPHRGLVVLFVEQRWAAPARFAPPPTGTWIRHSGSPGFELWATWDLGELRVPAAK